MSASTVFLFLLVLACPLMMTLMMRGNHRAGGGSRTGGCHKGHDDKAEPRQISTDDMRRERDELDRLIEERERSEAREPEPTGSGRR